MLHLVQSSSNFVWVYIIYYIYIYGCGHADNALSNFSTYLMDIIDTFPALPVVKISLVLKEKKRIFSPSFHCKLNGHLLLLLFLWIWKPTCLFFFWSYLISWCKSVCLLFCFFLEIYLYIMVPECLLWCLFFIEIIWISWFQTLFGFHDSRDYLDFMVLWISWFRRLFGFHGSSDYLDFMGSLDLWFQRLFGFHGSSDYLEFVVPEYLLIFD